MAKGKALIIGLSRIDPVSYDTDGYLPGCENDAATMQRIATKLGYEVKTLLTEDATHDNVVNAIKQIADQLQPGDSFLLTYAGHGSQIPERATDKPDEADGMDESWCLYDKQLVDDELNALWPRFPERSWIYMVSDSCHSGTMSREVQEKQERALSAASQVVYRVRRLPRETMNRAYLNRKSEYDRVQSTPVSDAEIKATVILLSGCQDNQTSKDDGKHGVFTRALEECYQAGNFDRPDYSFADLDEDIRKRIPSNLNQVPSYTNLSNKPILSVIALRKVFEIG